MAAVGFIALTLEVVAEGKHFVSRCLELGTASFGDTIDEAFHNVTEATAEYLNTLERLGERERVFAEKGITVQRTRPDIVRTVDLKPGTTVSSYIAEVPLAA